MKDNLSFVRDMLEHAQNILEFTSGVTEADFYENKEKRFAVQRSFEIIGEASKKESTEIKLKYPEIPWRKAPAFRDVLIHDYDRIIDQIVWDTSHRFIPQLKFMPSKVLEDEQ